MPCCILRSQNYNCKTPSNPLDENFGECNTARTVVALDEPAALLQNFLQDWLFPKWETMISVFLRYRMQYYATKFHNEHSEMPSPAYVVPTTDQGTVRTCSLSALRYQQQVVNSTEIIFIFFAMSVGLNLKMLQFVHVKVLAVLSKNYCSAPPFKWLVRTRKHCQGTEYR